MLPVGLRDADMSVAVVTGAGRGIGQATAIALADSGFAVGLVARTREELVVTADEVVARGAAAAVAVADVTCQASVRCAIEMLEGSLGDIDVLVNNAGTMRAVGPVWQVDPIDWWTDVQTSLIGAFLCSREVIPGMIARGRGRIVNVVSYAAVRPSPYQSAYAAAKAGLVSLTEDLAASLRPHGLSAFAVAPGFTDTEMTRSLVNSAAARRWMPELALREPVPAQQSTRLITWLATGSGDELNGRLLHPLDDVEALLVHVDRVRDLDLYVPRIRRLE
jgi:3-oxoacyl-[acyl-carrier protein] reductase